MSREYDPGSPYYPVPVPREDPRARGLAPHDPGVVFGSAEDEIDLRKIWATIHRYRWTIVTVVSVVVVSTITASLLMRPVYRGSSLVEIRPFARGILPLDSVDNVVTNQHREYIETQSRLIRSQSVAEAVIGRLRLDQDPEFAEGVRQRGFLSGLAELLRAFREPSDEAAAAGPTPEEEWEIREAFLERVSVAPVRESNLIEVSFDSFSPELAAEGVNAIVEEYIRLGGTRRFASASGAKQFLEEEIRKAQARLERSEQALNEFARKHNIVDIDEKTDLVTARVSELSSVLTEAANERVAAESLYRQVGEGEPSEIPPALESELVSDLRAKRAELSQEEGRLSRIYKDDHPKLRQLREEIGRVDASIRREVERAAAGIAGDFEKSKNREALLRAELDGATTDLLDLKDRAVQYHILKREWETNRELHAGLLERMKEVGVTLGMDVDNVSIIDRAKVPVEPYSPNLAVNAAAALSVGLVLGLGLAFLLGYLDDVVRTPEDFEALTSLATLGVVPVLKDQNLEPSESLECLSHTRRRSPLAEALRSVRTNLLVAAEPLGTRVLQVTSAMPGEGKTTTASNLAVVLAQRGSRVLLVDGDLRRPRLHDVFGVPRSPGLEEVLTGSADKVIHQTEIENLWFLPAGDPAGDPAELLGSLNVDVLAESAAETFDFVVIDSAPVLGLADSATVGTKVDAVLLVVSADHTRKGAVHEAVKRMRLVRAPLVGGIINKVDVHRSRYGYGYGYGYGAYGYVEASEEARQIPCS